MRYDSTSTAEGIKDRDLETNFLANTCAKQDTKPLPAAAEAEASRGQSLSP